MSGAWLVSYVALWIVSVVSCIVFLALLRQVGVLHTRLGPSPPMGTETPVIGQPLPSPGGDLVSLRGEPITLRAMRPADMLFVLFVSPGCAVCEAVLPGFKR